MGLNDTPNGERIHIAFFGCRNAGKSSLLNAVTGQNMAIVSDIKGTTTDPVQKAMELLPAGPVVIIDTPGLDDEGALGEERIKKAFQVLRRTDVGVLVVDAKEGMRDQDRLIEDELASGNIPYIVVYNKADLITEDKREKGRMYVSALTGAGIYELKNKIAELAKNGETEKSIAGDLIEPGDFVVLVIPIDKAAPKGRLILPQQQVIRDLLEHAAIPVVVRDSELSDVLNKLDGKAALVITDSQAFKRVGEIVPEDIPLTSFSILFSRYKGELRTQLKGLEAIDRLQDGDCILIAEGCTHHRQCGDIGTEKIPRLLREKTGKKINIEFMSGLGYPEDLSRYKVIIHCGGCMLNEKEMKERIRLAEDAEVPITNYGMVLAKLTGILERSIRPLKL